MLYEINFLTLGDGLECGTLAQTPSAQHDGLSLLLSRLSPRLGGPHSCRKEAGKGALLPDPGDLQSAAGFVQGGRGPMAEQYPRDWDISACPGSS